MERPKVIFLDAAGTLFGVQGSVGEVYGNLALRFGVDVNTEVLTKAFYQSFKEASPMAFPGTDREDIADREFAWWWSIVAQTFQRAGVLNQFADFSEFFTTLYDHFAGAEPWFVYPDIRDSLERWSSLGIELGVLSNFDSRLHKVLPALGLDSFFQSVTISTEVGAAKPDPKIFAAALSKHNCPPQAAWHVGDSLKEDCEGAKVAGMRGIWLRRDE